MINNTNDAYFFAKKFYGKIYVYRDSGVRGLLHNLYYQVAQQKYSRFLLVQWR